VVSVYALQWNCSARERRQPLPPVHRFPVLRVLSVDLTPGPVLATSSFCSKAPTSPRWYRPGLPSSWLFLFPHTTPFRPRQSLGNLTTDGSSVLASGASEAVALCFLVRYEAVSSFRACGGPYGLRDSLCTLQLLRSAFLTSPPNNCNTRYEWLVRPYSAGTFTPPETPSFPWRTGSPHAGSTPVFTECFRSKGPVASRPFPHSLRRSTFKRSGRHGALTPLEQKAL